MKTLITISGAKSGPFKIWSYSPPRVGEMVWLQSGAYTVWRVIHEPFTNEDLEQELKITVFVNQD